MAYLAPFEYDVFLSYARVDNLSISGDAAGWVTRFHKHLVISLSKRIGRIGAVHIWRDSEIDPSQLFDATIQEKIRTSAIFVALTSQGYLESKYCRSELRGFHEKAQHEAQGVAVGDRLRIVNVLLQNIPPARWPAEFGRTGGQPFHDAEREDELGEPWDPDTRQFQSALRRVADAIYTTLTAIQEASPASIREAKAVPTPFRVYVADTADSLLTSQRRLIAELRQKGMEVASGVPPPHERAAHEATAAAEIGKADLSVHLLDGLAGHEIDGEPGISYPRKQVELGLARGKPQLIWIPQQLARESIEDDTHKRWLAELENGPRRSSYDVVRGPASRITHEVLGKADQLRLQAQTRQEGQAPAAALLDTHLKDQLYALELGAFLLKHGVQPFINPEADDPHQNLKVFQERLRQVSILIVFFGGVAEEWVRARLGTALQIAIADRSPLRACGVYLAPPRQKGEVPNFDQGPFRIAILDNSAGFDPQSVAPLLAGLKGADV
ncbi:MAG TPA: TIR domain-containing protein [Bryobacteraceae bacterium]|nr:TIR domain-containing protein [Bryobacteraceae bacterium]